MTRLTAMETLFHYTSEKGLAGILASRVLRPSLAAKNPNDVRHGEGQYVSDIPPGTKSPGQLAYIFLNDPRGWRRFTHFVEIDVAGLEAHEGRPSVFVILGTSDLPLDGRIVRYGKNE